MIPVLASPKKVRLTRAALILSAGLFATTLAIGASAASAAAPMLDPATASVGGIVTLNVSGFTPAERLTVELDSVNLSNEDADSSGALAGSVYVPDGTALGTHTVTVTGQTSGTVESDTLTVVAQPTVSPATASVTASAWGTTGVKVTFTGFTAGESVQLGGGTAGSGGALGAPVTADTNGVVSYTVHASDFSAGAALPGEYLVMATNATGNLLAQTATITVVADPAAPATPVRSTARFTG